MPDLDERSNPDTEQTARLPVHPLDEAESAALSFGHWQAASGAGESFRLPIRYDIRESDSGRYLRSIEAPGVGVAVDLSYAFTEAEARKLGERTILLDGAGQFGPLIDSSRQLYNLDHHAGCSRAFTLAACEQALILVVKGIELDQGDWRICANEPDLDTLFAIWVLLNYRRLRDMAPEARDAVTALVRLEGAIDANGFELAAYCGLPHDLLAVTRAKLDGLHAKELEVQRQGGWSEVDLLAYVRDRLIEIDHLIYRPEDFADLARVEEDLGHVDIGGGRVAVVVRDDGGIYDVERRLKQVWGDRLGIVVLAKGAGNYTLRRAAALADIDLHLAYDRLNQLDAAVDGHPPKKRWGGSDEIGGSPRPAGTALEAAGLLRALRLTYSPPPFGQRVRRFATAAVLGLSGAAALFAGGWAVVRARGVAPESASPTFLGLAALGALVVGLALGYGLARGRTWQLGWRWPAGEDWLLAVPAVLVGAALGGVWVPAGFDWAPAGLGSALAALLAVQTAFAVWLFGLAHGYLVCSEPIQILRGRWFVSAPALLAGTIYAIVATGLAWWWQLPPAHLLADLAESTRWGASLLGAFVAGLAAALIRERAGSLLPVIAALALGSLLRVALGYLM